MRRCSCRVFNRAESRMNINVTVNEVRRWMGIHVIFSSTPNFYPASTAANHPPARKKQHLSRPALLQPARAI
jgi:hypothetical protein